MIILKNDVSMEINYKFMELDKTIYVLEPSLYNLLFELLNEFSDQIVCFLNVRDDLRDVKDYILETLGV